MTRNKLYNILFLACCAGYAWLAIILHQQRTNDLSLCIFKKATSIPCPSCGSTRSVLALMHGDFISSILWNPMGLIIALIMIAIPLWLVYDVVKKENTLFNFYYKAEHFLQRRKVAIPLIFLVVVNWIWNIYKGL